MSSKKTNTVPSSSDTKPVDSSPARGLRLVYLSLARLPTEKAHGFQISKTCEALGELGVDVEVRHPWRRQGQGVRHRSVFDYYDVRETFRVKTLPNPDLTRWWVAFPAGGMLYRFLWTLFAVLGCRRGDGKVFFTRDVAFAYWLTLLGFPTALELHTIPKRFQRRLLQAIASRKSLRHVFPLTEQMQQRLVDDFGADPDHVTVLPDAVDLEVFGEDEARDACREKCGLPRDRKIVGYVGRFQTMGEEKGIPELLRTVSMVSRSHPEVLYLLVGGPMDVVAAYRKILEDCGVDEDRVKFVDRVPNNEVPAWIRSCDVVTIPWPFTEFSAYFTSPMKLFEYMAAGVPIVASRLPSLEEILEGGETVEWSEPGDVDSLAGALNTVLSDSGYGRRLAKQARQAVEIHTWEGRAQRIVDALT